jgi:hypothetical protein
MRITALEIIIENAERPLAERDDEITEAFEEFCDGVRAKVIISGIDGHYDDFEIVRQRLVSIAPDAILLRGASPALVGNAVRCVLTGHHVLLALPASGHERLAALEDGGRGLVAAILAQEENSALSAILDDPLHQVKIRIAGAQAPASAKK